MKAGLAPSARCGAAARACRPSDESSSASWCAAAPPASRVAPASASGTLALVVAVVVVVVVVAPVAVAPASPSSLPSPSLPPRRRSPPSPSLPAPAARAAASPRRTGPRYAARAGAVARAALELAEVERRDAAGRARAAGGGGARARGRDQARARAGRGEQAAERVVAVAEQHAVPAPVGRGEAAREQLRLEAFGRAREQLVGRARVALLLGVGRAVAQLVERGEGLGHFLTESAGRANRSSQTVSIGSRAVEQFKFGTMLRLAVLVGLVPLSATPQLRTRATIPGVTPAALHEFLATPANWPLIVASSTFGARGRRGRRADDRAARRATRSTRSSARAPLPLSVRWTCAAADAAAGRLAEAREGPRVPRATAAWRSRSGAPTPAGGAT